MATTGAKYSVIRESTAYDTMFHVNHRLGILSNIVVSARYENRGGGERLTRPAVVAAVAAVLKAHPALQVVNVVRPSPNPGRHRLHRALLATVDVETVVEFVEGEDDKSKDGELLSRLHREWEHTADEPERPWWKVVVVGGRHVVFVYHHAVCDGRSGLVFHRELLHALNTQDVKSAAVAAPPLVHADPATTVLPKEPLDLVNSAQPLLSALLQTLMLILAHLLMKRWLFFSDLPRSRPIFRESAVAIADDSRRVKTCVAVQRIPTPVTKAILSGCHENKTSFTALLVVLWVATLSTDFYPNAVGSWPRIMADVRRNLPLDKIGGSTPAGTVTQASTNMLRFYRLAPFKRLIGHAGELDADATWELTRKYRATFIDDIDVGLQVWAQGRHMGLDMEDYFNQLLPVLGSALHQTLAVSNIGPFDLGNETSGPWDITESLFSTSVVNGNAGSKGLILTANGMKNGNIVIAASYEEDVVRHEMVEGALRNMVERMEALVS